VLSYRVGIIGTGRVAGSLGYRRVRQVIAEGAIGDLHSVTVRWKEGMLFGGTHLFETLRFLTGDEVEWVFGRLDAGDGVFDRGGTGLMRLTSGVDVFVDNAVGNSVVCEFDIVGTRGRLRITLPIANVDYAIADPWGRYS
jgi:predicted dehydrogenase